MTPQCVCVFCGFDLRCAAKISVKAAARRLDRYSTISARRRWPEDRRHSTNGSPACCEPRSSPASAPAVASQTCRRRRGSGATSNSCKGPTTDGPPRTPSPDDVDLPRPRQDEPGYHAVRRSDRRASGFAEARAGEPAGRRPRGFPGRVCTRCFLRGLRKAPGRAAPARVSVWRPNPKARRPKLSRGKRGSARSQLDPSGPDRTRRRSPPQRKIVAKAPCPAPVPPAGSHVAPPHAGSGAAARGRKPGVERRPVRRGRCAGGRRSAWVAARTSMRASWRTSSSRGTIRPPRRSPRRRRKNGPRGPAVPDRASRAPLVEAGERVLGAGERQGDLGPEDRLGKAGALGRHGEEGEKRALSDFATISPRIDQNRKRLNGLALPH